MKNVQTSVLYERLSKAAAYLERLHKERSFCGDPTLGKAIETRIIWRELLDLELQEFDEEVERLSECVAHGLVPEGGTVEHAEGASPPARLGQVPCFGVKSSSTSNATSCLHRGGVWVGFSAETWSRTG